MGITRTLLHTPRRFFYAFLWAKVPPEDMPVSRTPPRRSATARS